MARRDNAHSRLVGWLKLFLPLTALALLSMVFMVSRTLDPENALPYARVDIAELLRDPRLTAPSYSGMTRQGDEVEFTAQSAHPGRSTDTGARALQPLLRLTSPEGATTEVRAAEAQIQPAENRLELSGAVTVSTSGGYRLDSALLLAALDQTRLESPGAVAATAPMTEISANSMLLSREAPEAPEVLVFKGAVRLIYHPAAAAGADAPPGAAPQTTPQTPSTTMPTPSPTPTPSPVPAPASGPGDPAPPPPAPTTPAAPAPARP